MANPTDKFSVTKRPRKINPNDPREVEDALGIICKYCGSEDIQRQFGPHRGNHYAQLECRDCRRWLKWDGRPKEDKKKRSTKGHASILERDSTGQCVICLRNEKILPLPQVLEVHHVVEVKDGGSDEPSNIQIVCTACHKWIHHQRVYLGHYNPEARLLTNKKVSEL